jgi:hypothetical protein
MNEYVIGIGEIGLESTSFFTKNYKNFPECALVLAEKERLNINPDKDYVLKKTLRKGHLIEVMAGKKDYEVQLESMLKAFRSDGRTNLVFSISETFSAELAVDMAHFLKNQSCKFQIFCIFPFKVEGKKKLEYAQKISSKLLELCPDIIFFGGSESSIQIDEKKSITDISRIIFENIAKTIKQQQIKNWKIKIYQKAKSWISDMLKIAVGVCLGILGAKFILLILSSFS